jgi:predicted DNA-binding WGR domain protein
MIEKRSFELTSGGHNKFWTVQVRGKYFFATWGRIGTAGQTQSKEFASPRAAMEHATKMIGEKTGKGYTEVAASKHAGAPDHLLAVAGGGSGSGGGATPSRVTAPPDDEVQMRGLDL